MLTIADDGGRGGVYEPPILADVICEQSLRNKIFCKPPVYPNSCPKAANHDVYSGQSPQRVFSEGP